MQEQAKSDSQEQASSTPPEAPKTRVFRLVVGSASEAVNLIQKKFGTGATVQSVKQHKPKGVTKLWASPKLEIIVSLPVGADGKQPFQLEQKESEEPQVSAEEALPEVEEVQKPSEPQETSDPSGTDDTEKTESESTLNIETLLKQSDFDHGIIERLKASPEWKQISQHSLKQGLTEVIAMLKDEFNAAQKKETSRYIAFMGTSGVGKSTTLQKFVANRVFVHGKKVQILKLDNDDDPNPDNLLQLFCEIIGVPLTRDPNELSLDKDTELYVDLPGISKNQPEQIRHFKSILDSLNIQTRIWVINSLYDTRTIGEQYQLAKSLGTTHQVFTHLDELENWAKIWKFVLAGSYPLVFMNSGEETSNPPREEFLPLLVSKTFPKILLN
ncbi:MAG: hypothetical protein MI748_17540 [Opitutales bacterium]|nr:hypothetical protein [Opitutales bacterium]